MNKLLSAVCLLMAVAGLVLLFTLDSLVPGLLLVVAALCITVAVMALKNHDGGEEDKRDK